MEKTKSPNDSLTQMTQIVMPNETNGLNNLAGGVLMHWMDLAGAIAAQRHANRVVVTAAVDFVSFETAIALNEVVILEAQVTRAFTTSMEVQINVYAESPMGGIPRRHTHTAYFTFVAVDQTGRPIPVVKIAPETEEQERLYERAAERRQLRLEMANRK